MAQRGTLTPKQRAFIDAYLANGRNGVAAYRSTYGTKGAVATVQAEAKRLLSHPLIAPLVAAAAAKSAAATEREADRYAVTEARVVAGLAQLAFSDIRGIMEQIDTVASDKVPAKRELVLRDLDSLTDAQAFAITELTELEGGRMRVKLADKRAALVDLGKILKLFVEQRENTLLGADGKPINPGATFVLKVER